MLRHDDVNTLRSGAGDNVSKSEKKKNKNKKSKDRPESVAGADWTWKEQVDLVKFTKSPIQASLLQLDSNELNKLALEGFLSIMKYMGDYPMAKGQSEVDSVYTILMVLHSLALHRIYHSNHFFPVLYRIATSMKRCVMRPTVRS